MGKKFTSTIEQRNRFIARKKAEGKSSREITRLVGLSDRQIRNINKSKNQGSRLKKKKGPGRPEVLSKGQKTSIRNKLRSNPLKVAKQ